MSAWVPCKEHLDLLVKVVDVMRDRIDVDVHVPEDRDELGELLTREVVASVSFRYPGDDVAKGELPGPVPPWDFYNRPYEYADHGFMPSAGEIYGLAACYSYQACEHPGWEVSAAHAICEALTTMFPSEGCGDGPWGWDEVSVAARLEQGKPFVGAYYPTYA